jgi:hypothetical protein
MAELTTDSYRLDERKRTYCKACSLRVTPDGHFCPGVGNAWIITSICEFESVTLLPVKEVRDDG